MGADQTPDPTTWSDNQIDNLLDRLAERAEQRDDLDLPGSGASRRGVVASLLGLGGAAAGAGVASAIGENESYGSSTGVVGTDSEPVSETNVQDLHAQDAQIDNLLEAKKITSGVLLAAGFDGADSDARLANAVAAASGGEKIILEQASYVDNLTTDKDLTLKGVKGREIGTNLDGGDWTFNGDVTVADIQLLNGSLQINGSGSEIRGGFHSSSFVVTVDASEVRIYGIRGLDIRFATDTSDCVVDAATGVQVTDNGNNTVGDIA